LHEALFLMALPAHSGPWPLIQFRNHFSQTVVGFLGQVISPSQGRYLNTGQHKHRINAYTHKTSMPWVGFEPTIPAFERVKTVHALDRAANVTGAWSTFYPANYIRKVLTADHSGRAVYGMNCFRSLERWDRGIESHSRHGCVCVRLFCVCVGLCVGSGLATGSSLVQGVLPSV
jgi:hypothetical protein